MNTKCILVFISMLLLFFLSAQAQETQSSKTALQKGDFVISLNTGSGVFLGVTAPAPNLGSYDIQSPSRGWFNQPLALNVEGKYFISNLWAVNLLAGFSFDYSPGYSELPGTGNEPGDIPTYNAVPERDNIQTFFMTGVDRYIPINIPNLYLYGGVTLGFAYSKQDAYSDESTTYIGTSIGEAYSFGSACDLGVDYYLNSTLFLGLQISPLAYEYAVHSIRPQSGLGALSSDSHGFRFLSNPTLKIGIKF